MYIEEASFSTIYARLRSGMLEGSRRVHPDHWQGRDVSRESAAEMAELLNVTIVGYPQQELALFAHDINPNLPWADEHFAERVSGEPLNPPPSWVRWPWAGSADSFREGEQFNHTYPERYWPRYAGGNSPPANYGIRGIYGDLNGVVELLKKDPLTRQAYLPIFFPEDTGIGDGGRKPCTLGYHFIMRDDQLHCYYPMRSCDLYRHFRDDVYLTVRLMRWVAEKVDLNWSLGSLTMHMTSLHSFVGDMLQLQRERDEELGRALS